VNQALSPDPPAGWSAIPGPKEHNLERVGFYLNHPSEDGILVPDSTRKEGTEERVMWKFVRAAGGEYWLGCFYVDTSIVLAKKLESTISQCDVTYQLLPTGKRLGIKGVICR
jgi:hypothetical protein